ncbi:HD domain-containing protein [Planococcus sp. N028]|uniref:HD domain-containing protein n=1 Tax=Planococcus shixiaomingii TaxID=3058393 RepID=A0ABT8N2G9_9BACL|nr:HD domain-containing phosphohydrolase [Planococcus sp. N028]MDN7242064.1 HD domain-containing protein [Planococcus sp. N028]
MKGLDILKNRSLETVENESTFISLLGRGNGIELMRQTVLKGNLIILFPGEDATVQEFFYILNGHLEVELKEETLELGPNDFFSAKNLEEAVQFIAKTDVTFLSMSTVPTFHYLSNVIKELRKVGESVEQKDRYTYQHSLRVARYAIKTATKVKLRKEQMENLFIASILHDIGKIDIPETILNKPEKLTEEEFDLVKKHPGDGAAMIRETAYADLADIVEQHHERIDGSGYPFGLKGEEISLEARIIGVADTFDAMTEDRAYRKAFSPEFAMQELKRLAGTLYDPEVVDAFEQVLYQEGKLS